MMAHPLFEDADVVTQWAAGSLPPVFAVRVRTGALRPLARDGAVVEVRGGAPHVGDVVVCIGGARLAFRRVVARTNAGTLTLRGELAPDVDPPIEGRAVVGIVALGGPVARLAALTPRLWTQTLWALAAVSTSVRFARSRSARSQRAPGVGSPRFEPRPLAADDATLYEGFHRRVRGTSGRTDALPRASTGDARPAAVGLFASDGTLVATELLQWRERGVVHASTLFVDPAYRRLGAAKSLGRFVVDLARAHGACRILTYIHVRHPTSERLHESLGYRPTGAWLTDPGDPFVAMESQLREWVFRFDT